MFVIEVKNDINKNIPTLFPAKRSETCEPHPQLGNITTCKLKNIFFDRNNSGKQVSFWFNKA